MEWAFSVRSGGGGCSRRNRGSAGRRPASGDAIRAPSDGNDLHVEPLDGQLVARFDHDVVALVADARVFAEEDLGGLAGLGVGAVVHEIPDGHLFGKLRDAAGVVGVEVGDHQVVDLPHAGRFGRGGDALGVAVVEPWPAGVHQHGFARRRHPQGRFAAFHVDAVDFQLAGRGQNAAARAIRRMAGRSFHMARMLAWPSGRRAPQACRNRSRSHNVKTDRCLFAASAGIR